MKLNGLVWNIVVDLNTRCTGIVVVKLPGRDRPIILDAALDVDDTSRAEVSPGEFFFARPHELHWFSAGTCQTGSFNGAFPRVLPTITRPCVGHDDSHFLFWNPKSFGEFRAHAERSLRACPDG